MRELVDIAEEYDALLVSDEVYDHFDFSGQVHQRADVRLAITESSRTRFRSRWPSPDSASATPSSRRTSWTWRRRATCSTNVAGSGRHSTRFSTRSARRRGVLRGKPRRSSNRVSRRSPTRSTRRARTTPRRTERSTSWRDSTTSPARSSNVERLIDEAGVAGMPGEASALRATTGSGSRSSHRASEEAAERLADYFSDR